MVDLARTYEARIRRSGGVIRRWRWDVVRCGVSMPDDAKPGGPELRHHLWRDFGYTFTWLGAAIALGHEVTDIINENER